MLSSLLGGVLGEGSETGLLGTLVILLVLRPLARNCWWSREGRNGLLGITCILKLLLDCCWLNHTI